MKMRTAIVTHPAKFDTNGEIVESIEVQRQIIQSIDQVADYKKQFPLYYHHVLPSFKRELKEGNTIIVNNNGGWCVENEQIKIKQIL